MTPSDDVSGAAPLDPEFEGLFRPDDVVASPDPVEDDSPRFEAIVDPVLDPHAEDAAQRAAQEPASTHEPVLAPGPTPTRDPIADTGRLFRSQGVSDHDRAVLALPPDRSGRLRTLERRADSPASPASVSREAAPIVLSAYAPVEPQYADAEPAQASPAGRSAVHRARSITGGAVYVIVIGVTLLVGFANALIADGDIGWPTGLALMVSSVYAALTVRRQDDTIAMIIPPVAFFITALTAGQLFVGSMEGSLVNRAAVLFFTLADNWIWIIGSTAAAFVIVLVRRRRG